LWSIPPILILIPEPVPVHVPVFAFRWTIPLLGEVARKAANILVSLPENVLFECTATIGIRPLEIVADGVGWLGHGLPGTGLELLLNRLLGLVVHDPEARVRRHAPVGIDALQHLFVPRPVLLVVVEVLAQVLVVLGFVRLVRRRCWWLVGDVHRVVVVGGLRRRAVVGRELIPLPVLALCPSDGDAAHGHVRILARQRLLPLVLRQLLVEMLVVLLGVLVLRDELLPVGIDATGVVVDLTLPPLEGGEVGVLRLGKELVLRVLRLLPRPVQPVLGQPCPRQLAPLLAVHLLDLVVGV